jgi:hypothetical protein
LVSEQVFICFVSPEPCVPRAPRARKLSLEPIHQTFLIVTTDFHRNFSCGDSRYPENEELQSIQAVASAEKVPVGRFQGQ